MLFKNLTVFNFTEALGLTTEILLAALNTRKFKPCGAHENLSMGWVSLIENGELAYHCNGALMICAKTETKVLPSAAVNEVLAAKIAEIEEKENRKLGRKERTDLKDAIIFGLLPKALTTSAKIYAYIDAAGEFIYIDTASSRKAEDVLSLLRKSLGSLPVIPLNTVVRPSSAMTNWLMVQEADKGFEIGEECHLQSPEEHGAVIKCKNQDLLADEVKNHLDEGKLVRKLALSWKDRVSFFIDDTLSIKKLKFLDLVQEQIANQEPEDMEGMFYADFLIMQGEIKGLMDDLIAAFGGLEG